MDGVPLAIPGPTMPCSICINHGGGQQCVMRLYWYEIWTYAVNIGPLCSTDPQRRMFMYWYIKGLLYPTHPQDYRRHADLPDCILLWVRRIFPRTHSHYRAGAPDEWRGFDWNAGVPNYLDNRNKQNAINDVATARANAVPPPVFPPPGNGPPPPGPFPGFPPNPPGPYGVGGGIHYRLADDPDDNNQGHDDGLVAPETPPSGMFPPPPAPPSRPSFDADTASIVKSILEEMAKEEDQEMPPPVPDAQSSDSNCLLSLLSDEQLNRLDSFNRRLSDEKYMDVAAVSNVLQEAQRKTPKPRGSCKKPDKPRRKLVPKRRTSEAKFQKRRKREAPTKPPSKCSRGTVCRQKNLVFSPILLKNGKHRLDPNGNFLYRLNCDACTDENNAKMTVKRKAKQAKCPILPDSAFLPDAPMPPHCRQCFAKNEFTKKRDGYWHRTCKTCVHRSKVKNSKVRKEFEATGNKETHGFCFNCCSVQKRENFKRANIFGDPEEFDYCNACHENIDPLQMLWDGRAFKVLRSIEKNSEKLDLFQACGCAGWKADGSEPCLVEGILATIVNDNSRPVGQRSMLLHYDHTIRWLKRHLISHMDNPHDRAVEMANSALRCGACHFVKTLDNGDLRQGKAHMGRRPDNELSELEWSKIDSKIKAFDAQGCCGDNKGLTGTCVFQQRWKELRQKLPTREFTRIFQWDHDLENHVKLGEVSIMGKDFLEEQKKCHLRCIFCHNVKTHRCGDPWRPYYQNSTP